MRRRFFVGLGAIVAVGFAVRIAYVVAIAQDVERNFDGVWFPLVARAVADGHGYVDPFVLADEGREVATAIFPPAYPVVLAVGGLLGAGTEIGQMVVSSLFGSFAIVLIGLLGRRLAGDGVGLVAAVGAALHPLLVEADGALMTESLYLPLIAACLLAAESARRRPSAWRWVALGALIGAASLTRSEAVLLVPAVAVPAAWRLPMARRLTVVGLVGLVTVAVLAPWTVRNWRAFDQPVGPSLNGATLVRGANCDRTYAGSATGTWSFRCLDTFTAEELDGADEADVYAELARRGVRYAGDNASDLPRVMAARLLRTWGLWSPRTQLYLEARENRDLRWHEAGYVAHMALLPLAVVGAVGLVRRRRLASVLVGPLAMVSVMAVLSYGNQRFRTPAEPALLVLAAAGALAVWQRFRPAPDGQRAAASQRQQLP